MTRRPRLDRRSFLARVSGGAAAFGAFALVGAAAGAQAPRPRTGFSDADRGPRADPAGHGRPPLTDRDTGPNSDRVTSPPRRPRSGCTDRDQGAGADPFGNGRHCTLNDTDAGAQADPRLRPPPPRRPRCGGPGERACLPSDRDSGPGADPAGRPRRRPPRTGVTDRDAGPGADLPDHGRGRN